MRSIWNAQIAGYFWTGNCSNFAYVECTTVWLYDCPQDLSALYEAEEIFDDIPINHQDTLMSFDPIYRQTYTYATLISCDKKFKCYRVRSW